LVLCIAAVIAAVIKATSPGPVFFGHERVGKDHRLFRAWKFRTMGTDAAERLERLLAGDPAARAQWEAERKLENDPRVTPFGRFLRRTSLDELPQFWNILLGQMSLAGPRPVTEGELARYGSKTGYVLSVKPGLSGLWQISGRSDTGYEERVMLDSYYIQNWSLWLDIWIIIKTVWVVCKGKGAY
ncbi:sugar transferase, partial [Treponema endosymbiont of Eucomonympha sp.]|uniref:sugar transferase n=1 Tax=Treponema endosymbiont of Eucomonympha sp. TaxID=1580831 RepID=UPI000B0513BF